MLATQIQGNGSLTCQLPPFIYPSLKLGTDQQPLRLKLTKLQFPVRSPESQNLIDSSVLADNAPVVVSCMDVVTLSSALMGMSEV